MSMNQADTSGAPPNPAPDPDDAFPAGKLRDLAEQALAVKDKALQEAAVATAELEQARRELAIERSALPDFAGKQFFISNYKGEATPEAIRAAAAEAGFVLDGAPAQAPAAPSGVTEAELAAHRAVANVAAGSTNVNDIPYEDAIRKARNPAELMQLLREAPPDAGIRITDQAI